jgi:hypothetical protein
LPVIFGVVAIVGLTVVQSLMTDRFVDSNVTAEQRAKLLEQVPLDLNEWKGEDERVSEDVRDTAGAVGCVSRIYTSQRTGERVKLWLIVGHARDISAHTPDVCFPSAGFSQRAPGHSLYTFVYEEQDDPGDAKFWTNTFVKEDSLAGRRLERVFWAWYNPKPGAPVVWEASSNARWTYGNTRALFKMYFTSEMKDVDETTEESPAQKFGVEFLPVIEKILGQSDIRATDDGKTAAPAAE